MYKISQQRKVRLSLGVNDGINSTAENSSESGALVILEYHGSRKARGSSLHHVVVQGKQ